MAPGRRGDCRPVALLLIFSLIAVCFQLAHPGRFGAGTATVLGQGSSLVPPGVLHWEGGKRDTPPAHPSPDTPHLSAVAFAPSLPRWPPRPPLHPSGSTQPRRAGGMAPLTLRAPPGSASAAALLEAAQADSQYKAAGTNSAAGGGSGAPAAPTHDQPPPPPGDPPPQNEARGRHAQHRNRPATRPAAAAAEWAERPARPTGAPKPENHPPPRAEVEPPPDAGQSQPAPGRPAWPDPKPYTGLAPPSAGSRIAHQPHIEGHQQRPPKTAAADPTGKLRSTTGEPGAGTPGTPTAQERLLNRPAPSHTLQQRLAQPRTARDRQPRAVVSPSSPKSSPHSRTRSPTKTHPLLIPQTPPGAAAHHARPTPTHRTARNDALANSIPGETFP